MVDLKTIATWTLAGVFLVAVVLLAIRSFGSINKETKVLQESAAASPNVVAASPSPAPLMIRDLTGGAFTAATVSPSASVTPSAKPSAAAVKNIAVAVSETGFQPLRFAAQVGDTLIFTNDGQANHWPELKGAQAAEPEQVLATGDKWQVGLKEAGSITITDKLFPTFSATIAVQ